METYTNVNATESDYDAKLDDKSSEDDDQVQLDSIDDLATQTTEQLAPYVYVPYENFLVRYARSACLL
jgi:hypothetical protein